MQAVIQYIPGAVTGGDTYGIYFINILDDDGNPTNGDNIIVKYRSEQGGVLGAIQTITIGGLSAKIYMGIVQHNTDPFLNYVILGDNTPGIPSPPIVSDLKIDSIQITQKADSAGNNGKVTITASCSYLPITYYIDDVLQTGHEDLTVTSGPHTAKVTDVYDNEVTQDFTVTQVSSILLSGPQRSQDANISRWNAAFNPIVFTYSRKDFDVTAITQDETTLKPAITINANITGLNIGDLVYLDAGLTNDISTYKGAYEVLSLIDTATFVIDTDYLEPDSVTGYCNINIFRPYYKVTTKIKYVDISTGRFNTIISTNRPGTDGITKADISNFLQSLLNPTGPDKSDYTILNFRDYDLATSYQISYAESWQGNEPVYTDISLPFYAVYAAKQLGEKWSGNLFDYVTFITGGQLAKFLSDFIEPSYTIGYPFDLGFIYSENIAGLQVSYELILLDINRQPIGDSEYNAFLLNENTSFLLNQDGSKFLIARQELVNAPISERIGLNRLLINQDFDPLAYYFTVQLFANNNAIVQSSYSLTEQLTPYFIDANLQVKESGLVITNGDLVSAGSFTHTFTPGNTYSFEATCGITASDTPALILMTITKDEVIIFQNVINAVSGNRMLKTGIAQPGAIYSCIVETGEAFSYTPTNIADNATVTADLIPITEIKTARIDKNIHQNIIYLRWIGLNGSWNYYRFNYSQDITLDIQNAVIIKNYVSDWENQQGIEEVISKNAGEKMQVYADALDNNDITGLQSIKFSPKVQYLTSISPIKWQTIIVNSSTFNERNTQLNTNEFSITFNLPSKNIQTQ